VLKKEAVVRNDLMMRWTFGISVAWGLVGLSGCATGADSLGSLDATFSVPSVTASVTDGDGRSLLEAVSGVTQPSLPSVSASEAPSAPTGQSADRSVAAPPVPAQSEAPSTRASQEARQVQPDVLLLAQAAESPTASKGETVQEEPYDPFAKAEGTTGELDEYDPWEPFNVRMFQFNRKLDEWVVKPVATVYDKVIPDGVEQGVSNIFHNMRTAPRLVNNVFQGKFKRAGIELGRFLLNTSFGVAGFFDFAKEAYGIEAPDEDFGQTLATYGTKPGPYLVVPILGSFTVRDLSGWVVDLVLDPFNLLLFPFVDVNGWPQVVTNGDTVTFAQLGIRAGYMVNERSINIETTFEGVEETVVDLYGAVRNAYLQKRAKAIRQ